MKKVFIKKILIVLFITNLLFVNSFVVAKTTNLKLTINKLPQCMDNRDNDGDGLIDYPEDPDCFSPQDDSEDKGNFSKNIFSNIVIEGKTIPNSEVRIMQDGQTIVTTKSDHEGNFSQNIFGYYSGNYNFGVMSIINNRTTNIERFTVNLNHGSYMSVNNVYAAPISYLEKYQNIIGEDLEVKGYGIANSLVETYLVNTSTKKEIKIDSSKTNKKGEFIIKTNIPNITEGEYYIYSKNIINDQVSIEGRKVDLYFLESKEEIENSENYKYKIPCDLNEDLEVDLMDFSILLFNWMRSDFSEGDFNNDGIIDIKDFSIMAYYWTGF